MGKITDITAQKKNKNRVNIFVDGEFVCGLETITVLRNRLEIGGEISEEELAAIQAESEGGTAFDKAVKYSAFRHRTKREIKRFLQDKGYTKEVISSVMAKLTEYGFVDDFKFCREYVAAYSKRDGLKKIKTNLILLGAEKEAIEQALAEADGQEDAAFAAAEKYIRTHNNFVMAKLKNHLYSRGFSSSDISAAAARVVEEYGGEDEDW